MKGAYIGSFFIYSQNLFSHFLSLLLFFVMLRFISPEEVGIFAAFTLVTGGAVAFSLFSLPNLIYQTIPTLHLNKNEYAVSQIFRKTILFSFVNSITAVILLTLLSGMLSQLLLQSEQYSSIIILAAINTPFQILETITAAFLISLNRVRIVVILLGTVAVIRNGLGILLLFVGLGLYGVIYATIVADIVLLSAHLILLRKYFVSKASAEEVPYENSLMKMLAFASPIYLNRIIDFFRGTIDRYLILLLSDAYVLGIYSVASIAVRPMASIATSVNKISLPDLSTFGVDEVYKRTALVSRYLFLVTIPIGLITAGLSRPLLAILAGPAYEDAVLPFMILGATVSVTVWIGAIANSTAQVVGKSRSILYATLVGLLVGTALSFLLIPQLSVLGAALVRVAIQIASFMALIILVKRDMIDIGFIASILFAAGAGASVIFVLDSYLRIDWLIPAYVVIGLGLYLVTLRIMNLIKTDDIQIIKSNIPKRTLPFLKIIEQIVIKEGNRR